MQSLEEYVLMWQQNYEAQVKSIKLFQEVDWTLDQKRKFALAFYHVRGHFYKFLWYLGSLAPDPRYKKIVLQNIAEEFGSTKSHEQYYYDFASDFGLDLKQEILSEENNVDFIKDFNHRHLEYIILQDWDEAWASFAAYEKLDNVDYANLKSLAVNMNVPKNGQTFFQIHIGVRHYESASGLLNEQWEQDSSKIKKGFEYIAQNQIQMWNNLSNYIFEDNF